MQNSFLVRALILFLIIYVTLLFRDIFFMGYAYIRFQEVYWDNIAFYEAFRATLPIYLPLIVLDLLYVLAKRNTQSSK